MTVEEVTELYINQGKNMLETAQALNVNLSYLRAFMQRKKSTGALEDVKFQCNG